MIYKRTLNNINTTYDILKICTEYVFAKKEGSSDDLYIYKKSQIPQTTTIKKIVQHKGDKTPAEIASLKYNLLKLKNDLSKEVMRFQRDLVMFFYFLFFYMQMYVWWCFSTEVKIRLRVSVFVNGSVS